MKTTCPKLRHYCCGKDGPCINGRYEDLRCCQRHPNVKDLSCGRIKGHMGSYVGYGFSVLHPESW